jgi:ankyrin repeat protein
VEEAGCKRLDAKANDGSTVLHEAAISGNVELCQWLVVDKGLDFKSKDDDGRTPLHEAAKYGNLEVVKLFYQHGATISEDLLLEAAMCGTSELCQYLVDDHNLATTVKDCQNDATLLHIAASFENLDVARWLLENRHVDNISAMDDNGETAIVKVLQENPPEKKWKLEKYSKPSFDTGPDGIVRKTGYSSNMDDIKELVKVLVEHGANVNAQTSDGKTILHAAVAKEMELLVKYLIENGADMHVLDIEGKTPFDYASDDMVKAIELAMPKLDLH